MRDHDFHFNCRDNIVTVLGRYRVMDKAVKEHILMERITYVSDILKLKIWNLQVRENLKIYF